MRKIAPGVFSLLFLFPFFPSESFGLAVQEVELVTDGQYFAVAQKMIKEAQKSIQVIMFEMGYYDQHPRSPSNLLIRELIDARKRGVKVAVILDVREGEDRTTQRNRRTGKILSDGGVEVIYDSPARTTHAKLLVIDEFLTLTGSANWSYNAFSSNHEVSLLIRSKELAKALIDYFNKVKADSKK